VLAVVDEQATPDPFEAELRSFRPVEPSRAVSEYVGRELAADSRPIRPWGWFAGAAAAVAACLLAGVAVWRVTRSYDGTGPRPIVSVATLPAPSATERDDDDDRPSLASYRRALSRSPAAVDELLDRHAARLLPSDRADLAATARVGASAGLELLR
jgi:hypothetical protein